MDSRTEGAAVALVRMVVSEYAAKYGVSFIEAFDLFVQSGMYDAVFDPSLRYWAEGPTYILDVWEHRLARD